MTMEKNKETKLEKSMMVLDFKYNGMECGAEYYESMVEEDLYSKIRVVVKDSHEGIGNVVHRLNYIDLSKEDVISYATVIIDNYEKDKELYMEALNHEEE